MMVLVSGIKRYNLNVCLLPETVIFEALNAKPYSLKSYLSPKYYIVRFAFSKLAYIRASRSLEVCNLFGAYGNYSRRKQEFYNNLSSDWRSKRVQGTSLGI